MSATVRNDHYRKVIELPREFCRFNALLNYCTVKLCKDARSFKANSGASLVSRATFPAFYISNSLTVNNYF